MQKIITLACVSAALMMTGCATAPYEPSSPSIADTTRTGSRIKQQPSTDRVSKDGPQRLRTIDNEEIKSTGALTVTDVLRRTGNNY